jgi:KH domain
VVHVPRRLHHRVSNDGKTRNHLRNRLQTYVSHDGVEPPPAAQPPVNGTQGRIDDDEETYSWHVIDDTSETSEDTIPWKLRSNNESNLQKAKEHIEELISSLQDQGNCTGYLGIPPEYHHLIIGRGGQRIGHIRDETGCTVDVPRRGVESDIIVIRGNKDGVEKAREMIIDAVESASSHRSNGSGPNRSRR